ncbi:hypothetical protein [Pectobacterium brasiliense]|uniref:hypothetical protein n=1 Tax=Pectobacterium brasiliense TaxID=180957 RepID=UPI001968E4CE|nr:hypothetical protein [Pectobacterium brasiliense]MBN3230614.1 hypothetical protein [Pectobacterium brasiliense]
MKIKCDPSIFYSNTQSDFFFSCMSAHRESHSLNTLNIEDLLDRFQTNIPLCEKLRRLTVLSAQRNYKFTINVGYKLQEEGIVDVTVLNQVMSRKAVIIIENEHSDSFFLDALLHAKGKTNILSQKNISWEVRGPGGCGEIPKSIESEVSKSQGVVRIIVVHDSDRVYPGQELASAQLKIIQTANKYNIYCHTLLKREIENYIPDVIVENLDVTRKQMVSYLKDLSSQQRDHYDYKIGFKKKGGFKKKDDESFNGLFESMSDDAYEHLKNGFGKDIADTVYNNHQTISLDDFSDRCGNIRAEFESICEAIENIL